MKVYDRSKDEEPRKCTMTRGESGFGFILCCETGCLDTFVLHVLRYSSADKSGLKMGDRIITVNEENVEKEAHQQVVKRLDGLTQITMVVVYNSSVESYFRNPNYSMKVEGQNKLRPRLIEIEKSSTGFDFTLTSKRKNKFEKHAENPRLLPEQDHFVDSVKEGGVAQNAGLRTGDRIIEVDGENVEKESHSFLIVKMKRCTKAVLLVVDEKTDEFFSIHNLSPSSKHLTGSLNLGADTCVPEEIFVKHSELQYNKNAKANRNVISQSNLMTSQHSLHRGMRNLAVSTPNLAGQHNNSSEDSFGSFNEAGAADYLRYSRHQFRSKVPAKNFSSKIKLRIKSFVRRERPSKDYQRDLRKFYDEIPVEIMTSSTPSTASSSSIAWKTTDSSAAEMQSPDLVRNSPNLVRNSPLQSVDSTSTSPSMRTTPRVLTSYSEDGESSSDQLSTASPVTNSNHKRIFSRSVYMDQGVFDSSSPGARRKQLQNTLSSPVELAKNPPSQNSNCTKTESEDRKDSDSDLSKIDFQVDLKTLKERVKKNSTKKVKARNSLVDYHVAHQVVNSY